MKIYRIVPMIFLVALSVRADIVLPITSGEDDIFGHGFGLPGFFTADQQISIAGPGFSFLGGGPIPACTTALPCTPGATFQPAWLSGPIGVTDLIYQGNFFANVPPVAGTVADFNFTFSSFVIPARQRPTDSSEVAGVFGAPFTAVGHFQNPTVQGGQLFVFVGQGTMNLSLTGDGPNWDLQSVRLLFAAAPEPSFVWPLALALLAVIAARGGRRLRFSGGRQGNR